jgi:hypothetical protein
VSEAETEREAKAKSRKATIKEDVRVHGRMLESDESGRENWRAGQSYQIANSDAGSGGGRDGGDAGGKWEGEGARQPCA